MEFIIFLSELCPSVDIILPRSETSWSFNDCKIINFISTPSFFLFQLLLYLITTISLSQFRTAPYLGQIKRLLLVSVCQLASEDVHVLILRTGYIVSASFADVIKVEDLELQKVSWITHKSFKSRKLSSCDPRRV